MDVRTRILLSRLLTRAGDQAWDFAVPLVLVTILPQGIRAAAAYFLAVRLGQVLLAPYVGSLVDRWSRLTAVRTGIVAQALAVVGGCALIVVLRPFLPDEAWWPLLVLTGLGASLGALITEIGVANDLVPAVVPADQLAAVNGRIKQIDLATEVGAPIVAGLVLSIATQGFAKLGFVLIAAWNVVSFVPEMLLLGSVLRANEKTLAKRPSSAAPQTLVTRLTSGWRSFVRQPLMPVMLAYALLWLSVLSPHGLLLASFLKDAWDVPEPLIGLFRGLGALFGLVATLAYPVIEQRYGSVVTARYFLAFQAVMVLGALATFNMGASAQVAFFACVLLSRIGLYGFSLGEMQLRQTGIAEAERGRVNGFASALTSLATLGLYGAGAVWGDPTTFSRLVAGSAAAVVAAAVLYGIWSMATRATR